MALREVVRQLGVHVGLFGRAGMTEEMGRIERRLSVHREQLSKTRTAYLFLAFGLLATGGLMARFGRQLQASSRRAVEAFQGIEFQGSVVTTILGETAEATDAVRAEMIRLGIETEFTALQAGQAMEEFARAGFDVNETIGAAGPALQLATAGLISVSEAANLGVGVFRGFNIEVETVAESTQAMTLIASELAFAATNSAATVSQLGEAMKFVAPAAEAVNIALQEVLATLMIGADAMVRAGIAGRALRMSLINITRAIGAQTGTTRNLVRVIEDLNLEFVDQQGNMLGLADIVDMLNERTKDLSETQRLSTIQTIFGTRAVTFWAAQLAAGGDAIRERELGLKAAAAKEAIMNRFTADGAEVLKRWRRELEPGSTALAFLTDEMGFQLDVAEAINDVISDQTFSWRDWSRIVTEASSISEITTERLKTLRGTLLILQASIDAMWASIGQEMAPVLKLWNRLLTALANWMTGLPGPIKLVIGIAVLLAGVILMNIGNIMMMAGSIVMLIAALVAFERQMERNVTVTMMQTFALAKLRLAVLFVTRSVWRLTIASFKLIAPWAIFFGWLLVAEHILRKGGLPALILFTAGTLTVLWFALVRSSGGFGNITARVETFIAGLSRLIGRLLGTSVAAGAYTVMMKIATAATKIFTAAVRIAKTALKTFWPLLIAGAIIAGLILLAIHWEKVVSWVKEFGKWLLMLMSPLAMLVNFLIGPVVAGLKVVADFIGRIVESIRWLIDNLVALGGWFMQLIGGSVIPEAVERGTARIQKTLSQLGGEVRAEFGIARPAAALGPTVGGRTLIVQVPSINVNFTNVSFGGGPEQMVTIERVTRDAVEESLKRFEREIEKMRTVI